jgi:hypothetical protein
VAADSDGVASPLFVPKGSLYHYPCGLHPLNVVIYRAYELVNDSMPVNGSFCRRSDGGNAPDDYSHASRVKIDSNDPSNILPPRPFSLPTIHYTYQLHSPLLYTSTTGPFKQNSTYSFSRAVEKDLQDCFSSRSLAANGQINQKLLLTSRRRFDESGICIT